MSKSNAQVERAEAFRRLHTKGHPVVLYNVWDAGSARAVADAGAPAIATGSWSVATAHGYTDGQALPLSAALDNLARIVASVELPVTVDLEAGYGSAPEVVADTVSAAMAAGAIGFNLEDQIIGDTGLYPIEVQAQRLGAARDAAERASMPAFINARTDIFLQAAADSHNDQHVDEALQRAQAYAQAGASGIFVPGLVNEALIERLCAASPLPVNIMVLPTSPANGRLAELGVARISYGPVPYLQMMRALQDAARQVYAD